MTFDEYQAGAMSTAVYPRIGDNLTYPVLGLCGEAGEIAEKVKKIHRDDGGVIHPRKRDELAKELGDQLWYLAAVASELELRLEDIAEANLEKLASRASRGVLHGSGDNR
jgi:NTP pyrophosphatase (non-canonical NTP hydrolase)